MTKTFSHNGFNLYNADCLEAMKEIPNDSVDMVLCDLPYGTTACKWDTIIPFEPLWEQYRRIVKPGSAITHRVFVEYLFSGRRFGSGQLYGGNYRCRVSES